MDHAVVARGATGCGQDTAVQRMNAGSSPFDAQTFRQVLGFFPTGVAVITATSPEGPSGMAVSSFTSVSLEPPLVAFLPDRQSSSWQAIRRAGRFCVNILGADQEGLCLQFARKGEDKFAGVTWRPAPGGAPILDGVIAWIDCELAQTFESGDHDIAVGHVVQLESRGDAGPPLVFFQGRYPSLQLGPTSLGSEQTGIETLGSQLAPGYHGGRAGELCRGSCGRTIRQAGA
jgi:flavin reductase (DIM6/NTAB) family NADH-FMN oxidoreductase RutF